MDDPILVLLTASVSFRHPAFVTETSAGVELDLHEVAGNRDEVIRFLKESCESARGQFLVPQLLEGMPGNPEAWSRPDFNLQMAGISGVRNGVLPGLKEVRAARRAFVRKLLDAGNEALAKKREGTAPPFPSAVPVTLSGASVSVSLNQGATQQVELTIRGSIAGSKHSDKAERTAKFHLAGSGSLPEILALLDQQTEALAMDALRELLLTTPPDGGGPVWPPRLPDPGILCHRQAPAADGLG